MAGRRRATGEPNRRERRNQRRRARFAQKLAAAAHPSTQVGVVVDHLRAVLPYLPAHVADRIATETVAYLSRAIENAYREEARL